MNFKIFERFIPKNSKKATIESPRKQEEYEEGESELYKQVRVGLGTICDKFEKPEERIAEIMKKVEPFFKHIDKNILSEEKIEEIRKNLDACIFIKDKKESLDVIMKALKPAIDVKRDNAYKYEEAQYRAMNESNDFIEINRLLSYGKSGPTIHIHAPAGRTVDNKITLYREGMKRLAEIINNDPEIKEVTATSPLVAEHQGLFTRSGFSIEDVPEEAKKEHFSGEEREIKAAIIDREKFLEKFLRK